MTEHELRVLIEFLTGGLLVGLVGSWLDSLAAWIRGGR